MTQRSAYLLSEVDSKGQEVRRLSAQAQLFLDLELPILLQETAEQGRVADFGCGAGSIAWAIAQAKPLASVWGLDADPKSLEASRSLAAPNLAFEHYALGQGQASPVGNLDLAFTRLVLLHVPDPVACLRDMARALAPGGKLYVVEADDSCMRFEPAQPWQPRVLELMEAVQRGLGGSRCRGAQMGELMLAAGLQPLPVATVHYCKSRIGAGLFAELFLPVLAFYLDAAIQEGLAPRDECGRLLGEAGAYMADPSTEIDMALFHWISTGSHTPA